MNVFITISTFEGGAEISADKLAGSLPDSIHLLYAVGSLLTANSYSNTRIVRNYNDLIALCAEFDQPNNLFIVTHRQVHDIVRRTKFARIICVCRAVPIRTEEIRSFLDDDLHFESWPKLLDGMNHPNIATIVAPSEITAEALRKNGLKKMVIVIGNIIDVAPSNSTTGFKVHLWSRNVPWKRHDDAYRVIDALSEVQFVVCSDRYLGPVRCNVRHEGWIENPWKQGELGDLVLSFARYEAFGRDVFDAMARGCLVGCFEGTAVAEFVNRFEAGSVFSQDAGVTVICTAVRHWSSKDFGERKKRACLASQSTRDTFSRRSIVSKWVELISKLG
jgi:hypothetical protein